jgi:hypothetical protein
MRSRSAIGAVVIVLGALWVPHIAASETLNGAGSTFIDPIVQKRDRCILERGPKRSSHLSSGGIASGTG